MSNLKRYLNKYAEPALDPLPVFTKAYGFVLVVPAYRESLKSLQSVWESLSDVLVILVVNQPSDHASNQSLLADIDSNWTLVSHSERHQVFDDQGAHVLLVKPETLSKGVGEARKIGADIACRLIDAKVVASPWIFNTDADAVLPTNYFADVPDQNTSFILYRFQHEANPSAEIYELSLLWYAAGVKSAGSIYGFPSVGSCIACSAEAYATVRGFPKRLAGEDFYLLNKLRKVGNYHFATSDSIRLSSRASDRVPFGTGPAISKLDQAQNLATEQLFYHPACFQELKQFLECLAKLPGVKNFDLETNFPTQLQRAYVVDSGLLREIEKQKNQKPQNFHKFLLDWFDGFRTMKFIHFVRDHQYPNVSLSQLSPSELLPNKEASIQTAINALWQQLIV